MHGIFIYMYQDPTALSTHYILANAGALRAALRLTRWQITQLLLVERVSAKREVGEVEMSSNFVD